MTQEQANWLVIRRAADRVEGAEAQSRRTNTENTNMEHETTLNGYTIRNQNLYVGDAVETVEDCRAIGGVIRRVNVGTIVRITGARFYVRSEHGNVQKFSLVTHDAVPQVDTLCRSFFRKL